MRILASHRGISFYRLSVLIGTTILLWVLFGQILYPALKTLWVSLLDNGQYSLTNYVRLFSTSGGLSVLRNTLLLGGATVIACGLIGTSLAFLIHYFEFPGKNLMDKLLLLPMMLPGIIIVFAFVQLYGESGLVTKPIEQILGLSSPPFRFSGFWGILVVHAYTQYVYFYITVSIAIRSLDPALIEAARNLGDSRTKVFFSVICPSIMPALMTSAAVTFMTGIGSFTAPSVIGDNFKVLTTQILLAKANNFMGLAAAQVVLLTFISLCIFGVFRWYEKKTQFQAPAGGSIFRPVRIRSRPVKTLQRILVGLLIVSILLPVLTIVFLSFVEPGAWMVSIFPERFSLENYTRVFTRARTFSPFRNSIIMSLIAAGICLAVAVPSSYIIEKTRTRLRWVIEALVMLPWAMPCSAIAINLINAGAAPNPFYFNQVLVGTFVLLPIGYFIRSIPLVVKTTHVSFQGLNTAWLEASKSLGASPFSTFYRVVLPVIAPGLAAGFLLVFVRSIGEYTVSAFLYTAGNRPVSIAMVNAIFEYNIGLSMTYGTLLIGVCLLSSLAIGKLTSRYF